MGRITVRPNKEMKQTKPAQAMELRSLSRCWTDILEADRNALDGR